MFNQETDERLLERAVRGDESAFVEVYHRHRDAVFGFAYRLIGSIEIAEDITHDCFLSLMKNLERYDSKKASLKTYLLAAVRNLALKHFNKTKASVSVEDLQYEIPVKNLSHERLIEQEVSALVQKAIIELPPYQREALILFEYENLSLLEIAEIIGIDANAVKQRLHRARTNLRKTLSSFEYKL